MNLQQLNLHLKRRRPKLVCKAVAALLFTLKEHTLHTEAEICSEHVTQWKNVAVSGIVNISVTQCTTQKVKNEN